MSKENQEIENNFIENIVNIEEFRKPKLELLDETDKEKIETLSKEIETFFENNKVETLENLSEEEVNTLQNDIDAKWRELATTIKEAKCNISFKGLELKVIANKLHQNIIYTGDTIYQGIHIRKYFIDELPAKITDMDTYVQPLTFKQAIIIHNLLSSLGVKGLNKETLAFANILYTMSEVSMVYNHYDILSKKYSQTINMWNMGINTEQLNTLENEVSIANSILETNEEQK